MATAGKDSGILLFQTLSSAVEVPFWVELSQNKIDLFRLDDSPRPVQGYYAAGTGVEAPARLCLSHGCLLSDESTPAKLPPFQYPAIGTVRNTNTLDEFKRLNWTGILADAAGRVWSDITSGAALADPWLLTRFALTMFADLKRYKYTYFFAFPSFIQQKPFTAPPPLPLAQAYSSDQVTTLHAAIDAYRADDTISASNRAFFLVRTDGGVARVGPLASWHEFFAGCAPEDMAVGFVDPSGNPSAPGWHLRNLLLLLQCQFGVRRIRVICLRENTTARDIGASIVVDVEAHEDISRTSPMPKATGWEKNDNDKLQPRSIDLAPLMDPGHLASTSVDLNLKLMRWRLLPSLDLARIAETRCLLLGAGTLGCNVARALLGWGVRHITLVDNGRVSFSNPVRQSLFEFEDCLNGGKPKAVAAAEALKRIFPKVTAQGFDMMIPMPGHHVSDEKAAREDVARLTDLIASHDAIFLLMDSRESRWLPTMLGAHLNKIVINCALGFDTFVVMRHGANLSAYASPADRLGCYYCNDVVAPSDSLSDRTLDQQCTVTRPGLSFLASAYGVELLVSLLQHPQGIAAPASVDPSVSTSASAASESVLGAVPHQLRGFLAQFKTLSVVGRAYDRCTACSARVLEQYATQGFDFLRRVFDDPKYLENVTGLADMHKETEEAMQQWDAEGDDDEDDF